MVARRVAVVGGTGFLGTAFVRELYERGHTVRVLSRHPEKLANLFRGRSVEARAADVTRPDSLPPALEGAEVVIHCVQFPGYPVEDPARGRTFMEVDARGTLRTVRAASQVGVRRFVYLSGVGADPDAPEAWFRAKGVAEQAVAASGMAGVRIRPSWVYGPEDVSLNRFVTVLRRVPLFFPQLGPGSQRINPLFVEDLAPVVAEAATEERADGTAFEIGGPITYSMDEIIRLVMEAIGLRKPIVHFPLPLLRAGAAVLERVPGQLLSRDAVRFVTQGAVAHNERFRELFPGAPLTPMPEALGRYLGRNRR